VEEPVNGVDCARDPSAGGRRTEMRDRGKEIAESPGRDSNLTPLEDC